MRLIHAPSRMCGHVETEVNCWRKESSADVPRQTREWVQVVGGSNLPCPTKLEPISDNGGAPPMLAVGGRYDLEFGNFATESRITTRHMRTRYTIGDPAQKAIVGRIS